MKVAENHAWGSQRFDRRTLLEMLGKAGAAVTLGAGCLPSGEDARPEVDDDGLTNEVLERLASLTLSTQFTLEYGVQLPIANAGMAQVALPALAAAVSNAGGLGFIGVAADLPAVLATRIQQTRALTVSPFGLNFIVDTTPSGPFFTEEHLDVCVAEQVSVVVFHWNVPPAAWVTALQAVGTKVWAQVGSVDAASQAVAVGVDAVIAQGVQAGGHVRSTVRTLPLVNGLRKTFPSLMVLAAGGMADGHSIVQALARGAAGVVVGTRFVASTEAYAHPNYKARLVAAKGGDTALQTIMGPEWPGQRARILRNEVVKQWAGKEAKIPDPPPPPAVIGTTVLYPGVLDIPYAMPKFSIMIPTPDTVGDFEEMNMPAGSDSVKAITSVKPAAQILAELVAEAQAVLDDA